MSLQQQKIKFKARIKIRAIYENSSSPPGWNPCEGNYHYHYFQSLLINIIINLTILVCSHS